MALANPILVTPSTSDLAHLLRFNQITLIAKNSLPTQLLLECLRSAFSISIQHYLVGHLPEQISHNELILINHQDLTSNEMVRQLNSLQQTASYAPVAVVNTQRYDPSLKLIEYPNIKGIFNQHDSKETLIKGIKHLDQGEHWFPREYVSYLAKLRHVVRPPSAQNNTITPKETQILALLFAGESNQTIADQLFISPHTVKTHLYNLYRKIGVKNRAQAAQWFNKTRQYQ